jgi:hypothetical protein
MRLFRRCVARFAPLALFAAGPVMLLACSKSGESAAAGATDAASASSVAPSEPPSAYSAQTAPSVTPSAYMSLPERFNAEQAHRPKGVIRVEDATAAFRKAGLTIDEEKQHLASFYKAIYCVGAKAKGEELSFSVCEYTDEPSAIAGKALNDKSFSTIKNRTTYRNGATTLTVLESNKTAENDVLAKKLVDTFGALKAPAPTAPPAPTVPAPK